MSIKQKIVANLDKLAPDKQLMVLYVVESLTNPTIQLRSKHPDQVINPYLE
jgi:hypothetical protein